MILVDTSAWVEYDRRTESRVDWRVDELVRSPGLVAVTEPVIAEVGSRARTDRRERELRDLLDSVELLTFGAVADRRAIQIYRQCRNQGVTPRGLLGCMVASVALRHDVAVLVHDSHHRAARTRRGGPTGVQQVSPT